MEIIVGFFFLLAAFSPGILVIWLIVRGVRALGRAAEPRTTTRPLVVGQSGSAIASTQCPRCSRPPMMNYSPSSPVIKCPVCGVVFHGVSGKLISWPQTTVGRATVSDAPPLPPSSTQLVSQPRHQAPVGGVEPSSSGTRHFSGDRGYGFSLSDQMRSIGIASIDDLYRRLSSIGSNPSELGRSAADIASIPNDDDYGRVISRLMFACSRVRPPRDPQRILQVLAALNLAQIPPPPGNIDETPTSKAVVAVVLAGVDASRASGLPEVCTECVGLVGRFWANDPPPGDFPLGGHPGRVWVAATVLVEMAELVASSREEPLPMTRSLAGTPPGENLTTLVQQMWSFGRAWATAQNLDFDEYVRKL